VNRLIEGTPLSKRGRERKEVEMVFRFGVYSMKVALFSIAVAFHPISAEPEALEKRQALFEQGQERFGQGQICLWSGLALIPVSLLAAIPVWYDGAFGITAADPGFAIVPAVLGAGLMHAAIPLWGFGAEKMERAASAHQAQAHHQSPPAWEGYRNGWSWIGRGGVVLVAALPFAALAGLQALGNKDGEITPVGWTAITLAVSGASLTTFGLSKQYLSAYRFYRIRNHSESAWTGLKSVKLGPRLDRNPHGEWTSGLVLAASF
jgi:hypothetical protein